MSKKYALVLWVTEYSLGVMLVSATSAVADELHAGLQTKMRWTQGRKKIYDIEILKISGTFIVSYLILHMHLNYIPTFCNRGLSFVARRCTTFETPLTALRKDNDVETAKGNFYQIPFLVESGVN